VGARTVEPGWYATGIKIANFMNVLGGRDLPRLAGIAGLLRCTHFDGWGTELFDQP